jgi:hypothetical protein
MLHFIDNPTCAALKLDKDPRISSVKSFHWFCSWQRSHPDKYCAECAATSRTDSERYAELRALVEAWQHWQREPRYDQADAPERLMDWSHR